MNFWIPIAFRKSLTNLNFKDFFRNFRDVKSILKIVITWIASWMLGRYVWSCCVSQWQCLDSEQCSRRAACRRWHRWRTAWPSASSHRARPRVRNKPSQFFHTKKVTFCFCKQIIIQSWFMNPLEWIDAFFVKIHTRKKLVHWQLIKQIYQWQSKQKAKKVINFH